ncbi:hypothetical protein PLESTM_000076200 [Pleodorina starrii]|nr:hypothetical protein PLESTM_000076200 [Pleodorina starrii]
MWAGNASAYLYVTDTACNATTGTPCLPATTAALTPLSCTARTTCQGQTTQLSSAPLCLVVANLNTQAPLEVDLYVSGSFTPAGGSGSGRSSRLSRLEIVLISVGSAAGLVILAGLIVLTAWLLCCKLPPRPQVVDVLDIDPGAGNMLAGSGGGGGKPFMVAATAAAGPRAVPTGPQPLLLSPATVYPYSYPPYGIAKQQYDMVPPGSPYSYVGSMKPTFPSPCGGVRSPSLLAPLPAAVYGALSPQPPRSPPPLLSLPPLPLQRKAAVTAAGAAAAPPPSSPPQFQQHQQHQPAAPTPQQQNTQQQGLQAPTAPSPAPLPPPQPPPQQQQQQQ